MSTLLSNTFRSLSISTAFVKSILSTTPINIQLRDVHLKHSVFQSSKYRVIGSARKTLEKKLGFALKPKEPLSPYFRFMKEVRPSVTATHPNVKPKDLFPIFAKMWNSLEATAKEKYINEYKSEMLKHSDAIKDYNRELTDDQKRMIEEKVSACDTSKLIRSYKKRASELGKPKKPVNSFLKYFHEQTDRKADEEYKVYMKRISRRWNRLKKAEKEKYKLTAEELENYKKAMLAWETKITDMIRTEGEETVVHNRQRDE